MSAVTQPRWLDDREVVRCECGLIQFKAKSGLCLKSACRKPYVDPRTIEPKAAKIPEIPIAPSVQYPVVDVLPAMLTVLRRGAGLSQNEMAKIMRISSRTYISKIENAKALPNLSSFERICRALDISMENLLYLCEHIHEQAA